MRNPLPFSTASSVEVGVTPTTVLTQTLPPDVYDDLWCEVENMANGSTLDQFQVQVKPHKDASFCTVLSSTDFDSTSLETLLFCTSTGPHELPLSSTCAFRCRVAGAAAVRLRAAAVGSSPNVKVRGRFFSGN